MPQEQQKNIALSLLCVVCDRDRSPKVLALLEGQKAFFNLVTLGEGTASNKMLNYMGLGRTEKSVFFCIMPSGIARQLMDKLDESMNLGKAGRGITFTVNVHEGCYHRPVHFTGEEDGGAVMQQQTTHDLIIVVLNRGYTEEVMDVARAAGARGGTVLHARGCGLAGAEKFFGVTIQPEKEMLMILAEVENSCAIMGEIADKLGPGTDTNAISFSVPVNGVRGFGSEMTAAK
ncbi:hypothetical protein LJC04_01115 [Ruminococcaceae bacterium OttesenSCG-928-O06]|nr:hypothetical protein [Ruminococcaceae bacterium OttesenSCG-928-O06]